MKLMKNTTLIHHGISLVSLFFVLCPLLLIGVISFLSPSQEQFFVLPLTFKNYLTLLNSAFAKVFLRSLFLAIITTLCCLVVALPFSYYTVQQKKHPLIFILCIIPFWTSSLVRTYAIQAILKTHGLFNNLLLKLHIIEKPLELLYTNSAVLIGMVYNLLPFAILPLYTSFLNFDFKLIDAANDLGAKKTLIARHIILPHCRNSIVGAILMTFLPAMTLFYIPNILGGARSLFLGNYIENLFLFSHHWPSGAAISVLLSLMIVMILKLGSKKTP